VLVTCAFRFSIPIAAALAVAAGCPARARAQQPIPTSIPVPPPAAGTATLAPYRAPLIALVQPAPASAGGSTAAGSVPRDRPVVVFRFAAGEPDDPLDVRSFVVAVDGADRTALFQTTVAQAWGSLASDEQRARGELAVGAHRVVARICSTRGACGVADAQVVVVPALVDVALPTGAKRSRLRRALGALGDATRQILLP
jgi:hypothetical protein